MPVKIAKPKALILDLPNTIKPTDFTERTLIPFINNNIAEFLNRKWEDNEIKDIIRNVRNDSERMRNNQKEIPAVLPANSSQSSIISSVAENVKYLTLKPIDPEPRGLQRLKSAVWMDAFKHGTLQTEVYNDFIEAAANCKRNGVRLFGFTGSQKNIHQIYLSYTVHGNLKRSFDFILDYNVGPQNEKESYEKMLPFFKGAPPAEVVFITDSAEFARAAQAAGLTVAIICRKGPPKTKLPNIHYITLLTDVTW